MVRLRQLPCSPTLGGVALACLLVRPASAEPVHSLRLPAPVSGLAEAAEIGGERPAARVLADVIRAIYPLAPGISKPLDARRARVMAWLESPQPAPETGLALVPSPLPGDCWRAALDMPGATEEQISVRMLMSRDASLVYYGLMEAAPGLRAFLGSRPELVAALVRQNAGVLAAFPRAVDVVDGRVPVPGGAPLERFWESLVGAPVTDPSAFLLAVQTRAEGRMAFMLDTLWRLDEARRRFASSDGVASLETRAEDLAVLADAFVNTHREWRPAERPFWRVRMDPLVALAGIDVGADGRLTGPQAREFWMSVLDGQAPRTGSTHPGDVREAVTAGWLVSRVVSGSDGASQLRLGAVAFTQRLLRQQPGPAPVEAAVAGRAFADVPALMLVLERMGVTNPQSFVRAAEAARALTEGAAGPNGEAALTTFQASVAIIDRAVARRSLDPREAATLLDEMCGLRDLGEPGGRRALTRWVGARLVPAMANDGDSARDAEAIVIDALAGAGKAHPDAAFRTFELDGESYRLDLTRPEHDRLALIRQRQRSVHLAVALALVRDADALLAAGSDDEFGRVAQQAADRLGAAMSPQGTKASSETDEYLLSQARRALETLRVIPPVARGSFRQRVLGDVNTAADWAVADALRGMVYAANLGDAEGVVTLAPDIGRRHRLGAARVPGQALAAWSLPEESRDDAQVWFVRGALLGLEHALSALALRSVAQTADAPARFIYEIARRQLAFGVALVNPFDATTQQRDDVAEAARRGMREAATLCAEGARPLAEWTGELNALQVAWACVHDRSSIGRLITLDWLVDAGGSDHSAAMRGAWGTVRDAVVTGLRPSWPQRHDRLAVRERVVSGLFLSATVGPSVRIAQVLEARGLPGALGPALLSSLVADLIREAPVSFEGDAFGLALGAGDVPEERFDGYLAALAAGGPIVPATSANSEPR